MNFAGTAEVIVPVLVIVLVSVLVACFVLGWKLRKTMSALKEFRKNQQLLLTETHPIADEGQEVQLQWQQNNGSEAVVQCTHDVIPTKTHQDSSSVINPTSQDTP